MKRKPPKKLLSREDEADLIRRWKEHQDTRARDRLFKAFEPMVAAMTRRMCRIKGMEDDIRQEGYLGLMIALDRFDLSRELRFSTYAQWWVFACIQEYIFYQYQDVRGSMSNAGKRDIFSSKVKIGVLSIDSPIPSNPDLTFAQMLESEEDSPEDIADRCSRIELVRKHFGSALARFSKRDQYIARERFLSDEDDKPTLAGLGKRVGITQERVRQIEIRLMRALRAAMTEAA